MSVTSSTLVEPIKKIMGISSGVTTFDSIIETYISGAKLDLENVGIDEDAIVETDALISNAITSYVLSHLDVPNAELYANSYEMQKDAIRHYEDYRD